MDRCPSDALLEKAKGFFRYRLGEKTIHAALVAGDATDTRLPMIMLQWSQNVRVFDGDYSRTNWLDNNIPFPEEQDPEGLSVYVRPVYASMRELERNWHDVGILAALPEWSNKPASLRIAVNTFLASLKDGAPYAIMASAPPTTAADCMNMTWEDRYNIFPDARPDAFLITGVKNQGRKL